MDVVIHGTHRHTLFFLDFVKHLSCQKIVQMKVLKLIPVASRPKERTVLNLSNTGIVGSTPDPRRVCMYVCMYVCMSASFCAVLSCADRGLAMGRCPIQVVLPKCPKWIQSFRGEF